MTRVINRGEREQNSFILAVCTYVCKRGFLQASFAYVHKWSRWKEEKKKKNAQARITFTERVTEECKAGFKHRFSLSLSILQANSKTNLEGRVKTKKVKLMHSFCSNLLVHKCTFLRKGKKIEIIGREKRGEPCTRYVSKNGDMGRFFEGRTGEGWLAILEQ